MPNIRDEVQLATQEYEALSPAEREHYGDMLQWLDSLDDDELDDLMASLDVDDDHLTEDMRLFANTIMTLVRILPAMAVV